VRHAGHVAVRFYAGDADRVCLFKGIFALHA